MGLDRTVHLIEAAGEQDSHLINQDFGFITWTRLLVGICYRARLKAQKAMVEEV